MTDFTVHGSAHFARLDRCRLDSKHLGLFGERICCLML